MTDQPSGVTLPTDEPVTDEMVEAGAAALSDYGFSHLNDEEFRLIYAAMRAKVPQSTSPIEVGGLRELIERHRIAKLNGDRGYNYTGLVVSREELDAVEALSQSSSPTEDLVEDIAAILHDADRDHPGDYYTPARKIAALAIRQPFVGGE